MIYIPCIATIAVLAKELGRKTAVMISLIEMGLAFGLGGLLFRVLLLFGIG